MQGWEYKMVKIQKKASKRGWESEIEARLAELGAEGWEAVGMLPWNVKAILIDAGILVLMKRPIAA